ncbi:RDD family protein [Mesorhizobium sp. BAC0120]|uniref:RDD family protein n=1 Tax=Mesorhizobium sp. BAC0120 TaxID=3090670 RepID=UPI00298CD883|nr:RDD family protein [Mesorhizobium sp. BAC0120]MDW6023983.1 RDD family protein [Mesorhizobium sp. BAC0120]
MRSLVTPEGVDLQVRLGEAGSRAAAFLLDMVILVAAAVAATIITLLGLGALGFNFAEPLVIAWLILIFFLRNVYFTAFEAGRRAATPGKRIIGLRVISRDGSGLSVDQVIARNLMREIEVFLPLSMLAARAELGIADTLTSIFGMAWALLFSVFPFFNRDRLRIGDLLAGTWIVEAPKRVLAGSLANQRTAAAKAFRFTSDQLEAYGIAELHKLEEVLRGGNEAALQTVAATIQAKIGWTGKKQGEVRPFLIAYYDDLKAHLERKLLLGKRRADKYSR